MADTPWLTIVGLGEDGPDGLSPASRAALEKAELVAGAKRHLALLPCLACETMEWPVPFAEGVDELLSHRGRDVVMLASGDPFWFGAGTTLANALKPGEWRAFPVPSTFSLAASRLGWAVETTICFGLHAAPLSRLRPYLAPGQRIIALLRDGEAARKLATWLVETGFGGSALHVMEALGGPRERIRATRADSFELTGIAHPVAVAMTIEGKGETLPLASGRADDWFDHDGQITKRPVRAVTLSTLAPRSGELLWDIGTGSGSIAIEWLLAHPSMQAIGIEADARRAARARANADRLGVDRLTIVEGKAPDALNGLPPPDAVFIGGGLSQNLMETLFGRLTSGTRLVANAVTLESEALLADWQAKKGGDLLRMDFSQAVPLGAKRGWQAAFPVVQWSVVL